MEEAVSAAALAAFCRGLFLEVWAIAAAVLHPAAGAEVPAAVAETAGADLAAGVTSAAAALAATGRK